MSRYIFGRYVEGDLRGIRDQIAKDSPDAARRGSGYGLRLSVSKAHQITISMSRKGNPYDNAFCESFMKTLKYDEVLTTSAAATVSLVQDKVSHAVSLVAQECRDLADARASIERFLEKIYNCKRMHSTLDYRPPAEFERSRPLSSDSPVQQVTA